MLRPGFFLIECLYDQHISGQKTRQRQLNAKVCGSESDIFRILLSFFPWLLRPNTRVQVGESNFHLHVYISSFWQVPDSKVKNLLVGGFGDVVC